MPLLRRGAFSKEQNPAIASERRFLYNPLVLLLAALLLGIALRILFIVVVPPLSDVFYIEREAAATISAGMSPYGHWYAPLPPILRTPGADRIFAYFPFSAIFLVPFLVAGDIRLGFLASDVIVALAVYSLMGKWKSICSAVYLLVPFTVVFSTFLLNSALIGIAFLAVFAALELRARHTLGAVSLGLALASIQFTWLTLPFIARHYLRLKRWKEIILAIGLASAILLPFIIVSPNYFFYDTVIFQFARPGLPLISNAGPFYFTINITLSSIAQALFGVSIPSIVRGILVLVLLPFFVRKSRNFRELFAWAGAYVLLTVFILPNDFFPSYAELPFVFLLLYLAIPGQSSSTS